MQRSNAASLRFYPAFYQWSLLSSTSAAGHRVVRRLSRCQSSTATSPAHVRIHRVSSEGRIQDRERDKHRGKQANKKSSASHEKPGTNTRQLRQAQIQLSQGLPFETLEAWQFAVRYRSDAGLMVELAVTAKELSSAQRAFGEQLEKLGQIAGARLEVRPTIGGGRRNDLHLMSVLISGTYASVESARQHLVDLKRQAEIVIVRERRAMGLVRTLIRMDSVRQTTSAEIPPNQIPPWYFAIRDRSDSGISIAFSLPWNVWAAFSEKQDLTAVTDLTGAIANSGSSFVYDGSGPEAGSMTRCITLYGTFPQITRAKEFFESYRFGSTSDVAARSKPSQKLGLAEDANANSVVERIMLPPEICEHFMRFGAKSIRKMLKASQCHSMRFRNNANDDGQYVRIQGTREAVDEVKILMQESIDQACASGFLSPVSIREAVIEPQNFILPRTHYARVKLPHGRRLAGFESGLSSRRLTTIQRDDDCKVQVEEDSGDRGIIIHILGPLKAVTDCMRTFQGLVDTGCKARGLDTAAIQILADGKMHQTTSNRSTTNASDLQGPLSKKNHEASEARQLTSGTASGGALEHHFRRDSSNETGHGVLSRHADLRLQDTESVLVQMKGARDSSPARHHQEPRKHGSPGFEPKQFMIVGFPTRIADALLFSSARAEMRLHGVAESQNVSIKILDPVVGQQRRLYMTSGSGPTDGLYHVHHHLESVAKQWADFNFETPPSVTVIEIGRADSEHDFPGPEKEHTGPSAAGNAPTQFDAKVVPSVDAHAGTAIVSVGFDAGRFRLGLHYKYYAIIAVPQRFIGVIAGVQGSHLRRLARDTFLQDLETVVGGSRLYYVRAGSLARLEETRLKMQALVDTAVHAKPGEPPVVLKVLEQGEGESRVIDVPAALQRKLDERLRRKRGSRSAVVNSTARNVNDTGTPVVSPQHIHTSRKLSQTSPAAGTSDDSPTMQSKQTPEEIAQMLRPALRKFTHPVVVLTALARQEGPYLPTQARGMTMSSFNTVTLSPRPVVSFNIRTPSRTWDAIKSRGKACVHILRPSPKGAAIAHAFTQPYEQAHEPFKRLQDGGVLIACRQFLPPYIYSGGAVSTRLDVDILMEKCTTVGDHVVVLAEVKRVQNVGPVDVEQGALAYGMRGYRALGESIEPSEVYQEMTFPIVKQRARENAVLEDNSANREEAVVEQATETSGVQEAEKAMASLPKEELELKNTQDTIEVSESGQGHVQEPGDHDSAAAQPVADALNEYYKQIAQVPSQTDEDPTDDVAHKERPSDLALNDDTRHCLDLSGISPRRSEEDIATVSSPDAPTVRFVQLEKRSVANLRPSRTLATASHEAKQATPPATALASSNQAPQQKSTAKHASPHAWGLAPLSRPYSTHVRLSSRAFVTTSGRSTTDPAILKLTVEDFLCRTTDFPPRSKHLIRAKHEAANAERQLELALSEGTLTLGESANLENTITLNERRVARAIALRSAEDLSSMLDKGKVDGTRIQSLETSIERGQAVLLEEAKEARRRFDELSISAKDFQLVKKALETDHEKLNTAIMRLRASADEEDD